MSKILIIFSSTGGNTELISKEIQALLSTEHKVTLQRAEISSAEDPLKYDLTILACPTYGQGILEINFAPFNEKMKSMDYSGVNFCIVGLGDYKYHDDYHLESINIIEKTIKNSNGEIFHAPLRISKSPLKFLETIIPRWTNLLLEKLK